MTAVRRRALFACTAIAIGALGSVASGSQRDAQRAAPQSCSEPDEAVTLFAVRLSRHRVGFGLTPKTASSPGPTITMTEGECVAITLVNDADARVSLHVHGVDYTVASDGTPLNASCVRPGRSRTYIWRAHLPAVRADGTVDPGSAGYWHYHDHCMGTVHGSGGIRSGLFGALIVRRAGDRLPDRRPFVVVMGPGNRINMRKAPNTPIFRANQGERVEFVVIAHGDDFHTFHLHGHRWVDNRTGIPQGPDDPSATIDNRTVGPADSFGFQIVAGEGVGPGAWMFHCHVQGHSDAGMSALLVVRTPGGEVTEKTRAALDRWDDHDGASHH